MVYHGLCFHQLVHGFTASSAMRLMFISQQYSSLARVCPQEVDVSRFFSQPMLQTMMWGVQAVQVMTKICAESEASLDYYGLFKQIMKRAPVPMSPLESLASSAVRTAHKVTSETIVLNIAWILGRQLVKGCTPSLVYLGPDCLTVLSDGCLQSWCGLLQAVIPGPRGRLGPPNSQWTQKGNSGCVAPLFGSAWCELAVCFC